MGTGSTAVAALATGNCFLGIDTDPMCPFALRAMLHKCKPLFHLRSEGLRSLKNEEDGGGFALEASPMKKVEMATPVEDLAMQVIGAEEAEMVTLDEGGSNDDDLGGEGDNEHQSFVGQGTWMYINRPAFVR